VAKRKLKHPSQVPELAKYYFQNRTAIKKTKFMLSGGGTIEIGIFDEPVLHCTSGAILVCDEQGKVNVGTVCRTKDATGLEWYEDLHGALVRRIK